MLKHVVKPLQVSSFPLSHWPKEDTWFSPESQRNWSYKATGKPQIEAINATNPPQAPNMRVPCYKTKVLQAIRTY